MPRTPSRGTKNAAVLRARALRRQTTPPEGLLWQLLRKRPGGFKFRHQHPFDRCTLDFYCAAAKLAIEIDGDHHSMGDQPQRDERRDAWLRAQGVAVLRFDAAEVFKDPEAVVTAVVFEARRRLPLHQAAPGSPPHLPMGRN